MQQRELERFGAGLNVGASSPERAAAANYDAYGTVLGTRLPDDALATLAHQSLG